MSLQHPGVLVRRDCLEEHALSVTSAARVLGVTRQALNNLVNGKSGISAEMALRLEKAFGGSAESWLRLQCSYELALAQKSASRLAVQRVRRAGGEPRRRTP